MATVAQRSLSIRKKAHGPGLQSQWGHMSKRTSKVSTSQGQWPLASGRGEEGSLLRVSPESVALPAPRFWTSGLQV